MAKDKTIIQQIKRRQWKWTGHTLRKDLHAVEKFSIGTFRDGVTDEDLKGHGGER
jgi:hypothetical protein